MRLGTILRTIISRLLLLIVIAVYAIPILIFIFLPKRFRFSNPFVFWVLHWFYVLVLKCTLLPITFIGKENIPHEPVIFAANHQSSLDIPLVGYLANKKAHIWLAISTLLRSPIYRIIVPLFTVLVDASSPTKAMRSIREVLRWMDDGTGRHVMIFPEGGRYVEGTIKKFFGGFVILAKKTGRPVVPVCILGVNQAYPPGSFLVHWHPITVVIGKPFRYQEHDTDEAFKQRVRNWFIETMELHQ